MTVERNESIEAQVARLIKERIDIVSYDSDWPEAFRNESRLIRSWFPSELIYRVEHFGSTAIPGMSAKPIVDMLIGVSSLSDAKRVMVPFLRKRGYEYLWRPTKGDDGPPWYAWFIKRDAQTKQRTHHLHVVESTFHSHWDRLLFRDYLIEHPQIAREYRKLKCELAEQFPEDRVQYTQCKSEFVRRITSIAKQRRDGSIAKRFLDSLDREDYDEAARFIEAACVYHSSNGNLKGPSAIIDHYRSICASAKKRYDLVERSHRVHDETTSEIQVTIAERLTIDEHSHVYEYSQTLQFLGSQIAQIHHYDIPGQREQLETFVAANRQHDD